MASRDYSSPADEKQKDLLDNSQAQGMELLRALLGGKNQQNAQAQKAGIDQQAADADMKRLQHMKDSGMVPEGGMAHAGHYATGVDPTFAALRSQATVSSRNQRAAQQNANNDKVINNYIPRIDGAQKIISLMDAAEKGDFKANDAMLGQLNAEIARLETGSQSPGLHASEKTEMTDAAAQMAKVRDYVTGNVTGVDLHEKFKQAKGMVSDLGGSYYNQIDNRMKYMKAGALPEQAPIFEAKHAQILSPYKSFSPDTLAAQRTQMSQANAQAPQPGLIQKAGSMLSRFIGGGLTPNSPAQPPMQIPRPADSGPVYPKPPITAGSANFSGIVPQAQKRVRHKGTGQLFDVAPNGDMTEVSE